jgi:ATP-dependent protease ClpP protease subunit
MADGERARKDVTLDHAHASLLGELTEDRAADFLSQLAELLRNAATLVVAVTTNGGDAELARRVMLEIDVVRQRLGRRLVFVGKTQVHSAGVTIMSAFPKRDRYLSRDTTLLIHSRQLEKSVELAGPIVLSMPRIRALLAEMELGLSLEEQSFERLIEGSDIGMDELRRRAPENWYLTAEEAHRRGLVEALL